MTSPDYQDLIVVFHGELAEATILRSALEASGFDTFMEDENMKVTDPFATGASALWVKLLARKEDAPDVAAAIEELQSGRLALEDEAETDEA
jgi:hypothetical protein